MSNLQWHLFIPVPSFVFFCKVAAGGGTAVFWGGSSSYSGRRHWGWDIAGQRSNIGWSQHYKTSLSGIFDRATPPRKQNVCNSWIASPEHFNHHTHTDSPMLFLVRLWLALWLGGYHFVSGSNFVVESLFMRCHAVSLQATQPGSYRQPNHIKKQLSSTAVSLRHKMPIPRIWLPGVMYIELWKV